MTVLDTALRGAVPAGPVVVSAEAVRKSQASKAAQAERAAEVRISAAGWRSATSSVRSTDSLLQRLIHLGEGASTQKELSRFSPLGPRESLEAGDGPLASKLH